MYDKNYYLAHREDILARAKKWREEHPEQYKKALKRCIKRNKLKYALTHKLYRCARGIDLLLKKKDYYLRNREKIQARTKQYREENIITRRLYDVQRRFKKRASKINGWSIFYEIQNDRFYWSAIKDKFKISDEKENGFPSLHSAYKNAKRVLGE